LSSFALRFTFLSQRCARAKISSGFAALREIFISCFASLYFATAPFALAKKEWSANKWRFVFFLRKPDKFISFSN